MGSRTSNYLVFERQAAPQGQIVPGTYSGYVRDEDLPREQPGLRPLTCVGAIQADSAEAAVRAVIAATRRVGEYAVVECEMVGFNFGSEAGEARIELTP